MHMLVVAGQGLNSASGLPTLVAATALFTFGTDLLTGAGVVNSKGEVKRLVAQGAIRLDDESVSDAQITVRPRSVLKIGKRRWLRLIAK